MSDKIGVIESLLHRVDSLIIGGAMANTFLKAKGYDIGQSMVDDTLLDTARQLIDEAMKKGVKFYLPVDVVVADRLDRRAQTKITPVQEVPDDWIITDIGPATVTLFGLALQNAQTIIWNGPMGMFELPEFQEGTFSIARTLAESVEEIRASAGRIHTNAAFTGSGFAHILTEGSPRASRPRAVRNS